MLGMLVRGAARGTVNTLGKTHGTDPKDVKPLPFNPFCSVLVVAILIISFIAFMANSDVGFRIALTTFDIISISVLLMVGTAIAGVQSSSAHRNKLANLPNPENIVRPAYTAQELRSRADQLTAATTIVLEPEEAPASAPARPEPALPYKVKSRDAVRSEAEDDKLVARMAKIMVATCPVCERYGAVPCKYTESEPEAVVLDQHRGLLVHGQRIGQAIKDKTIGITEVVTQFDGNPVPDTVWSMIV